MELCAAFETRFRSDRAIDPALLANASLYEVQKANYESVVKYAMTVLELPKDGKLDDADRAALLSETQVRIEFETRAAVEIAADQNVRILVVPSDGTLAEGQSAAKQMDPHYQPPLSYDLDEFLMLSHLRDKVEKLLREVDGSQVEGWECTHLPALLGHAEAWINENTCHHIDGEPDEDDAFNNEALACFSAESRQRRSMILSVRCG